MMFGNGITGSGFNFGNVLNGISKTLNVANQAIPLYMQAKPMFQNAKSAFSLVKSFISTDENTTKEKNNTDTNNFGKEKKPNIKILSNPKFFL